MHFHIKCISFFFAFNSRSFELMDGMVCMFEHWTIIIIYQYAYVETGSLSRQTSITGSQVSGWHVLKPSQHLLVANL